MFDTLSNANPYNESHNNKLRLITKFCIAQVTAIIAGYASYPFDTVRTRLQMQSNRPKEEWIYKNSFNCFKKILKDEGVSGMFKGAGANALITIGPALLLLL